jgi:NACHT C-terminal Alpha/Beta 2
MRDEFTLKTKELIAGRADYKCSKPDCNISTRGAASDIDKMINIGVAAHITAASPNGPRYDPELTADERKSTSNGIWLCQTHANLIDKDENFFTVELLLSWKDTIEKKSFQRVSQYNTTEDQEIILSSEIDENLVKLFELTDSDDLQSVTSRLVELSKLDLSTFKRLSSWPKYNILLNLKIYDEKKSHFFDVHGLANATNLFNEISVISPPGMGKTTTLLQLAEIILEKEKSAAIFIPLNEWSINCECFFKSLKTRMAFQSVEEKHFMLLASCGRLVLILDGWNEINKEYKIIAIKEIKRLKREFPCIRLILGTRQKELDSPISGAVVNISCLSTEQQLNIAENIRGNEGEELLNDAWSTAGIRDLMSIPLYLTVFLEKRSDKRFPKTKEEILRMFIEKHERNPEKIAILRENLLGFHKNILTEIAVEATRDMRTAVSCEQARSAVKSVESKLKMANQISSLPEPVDTLDILVNHNMLVRDNGDNENFSFQHQQFQEWYASFEVENLMLSAKTGDEEQLRKLRESIINISSWEEAILFACDRLSRVDENGYQSVVMAVLETMGIDPLLASEMIYRSSENVWKHISEKVKKFVKKWHEPGTVDRAVQFMVNSGKNEFSPYVLTLISDNNNKFHLPTLRGRIRFRISVLGPNALKKIASLSESLRKQIIYEITLNTDMDGAKFITELAKQDTSLDVQCTAIEMIQFTGADHFITDILKATSDEVLTMLARRDSIDKITDSKAFERLKKEKMKLYKAEKNPCRKLYMCLYQSDRSTVTGKEINRLIRKIDFSDKEGCDNSIIQKVYDLYPEETISGLISKLKVDKDVPYDTRDYLRASGIVVDTGPLVKLVLSSKNKGIIVAYIIGPKTTRKLINQLLSVSEEIKKLTNPIDEAIREKYYQLISFISRTNVNSFATALLFFTNIKAPSKIEVLSDLIAKHEDVGNRNLFSLGNKNYDNIIDMVKKWAGILLTSPSVTRQQFANIARAIEKLESPKLVPILDKFLSEELMRKKHAVKEFMEAQKKGQCIDNGAHDCWLLQYQKSFSAIGDSQSIEILKSYLRDPDFGYEAACALRTIWKKEQNIQCTVKGFGIYPDFSVAKKNQVKRREADLSGEYSQFGREILSVVTDLIKPDASTDKQMRGMRLASVVFCMPYSDEKSLIEDLCNLPIHGSVKNKLLTVLVLAGEIIKSGVVMAGFNSLLKEAETKKWMLYEQNGYRLDDWLRLFLFSDCPKMVIDALDLLEPRYKSLRNFRGFLSALRYTPSDEAEYILNQLNLNGLFPDIHEYLDILVHRNTFSSSCMILDLICGNSIFNNGSYRGSYDLDRKLSFLIKSNREFREEVYKRYQKIPDASYAKVVVEYSISNAADIDDVLLLVRSCAAQKKTFQETCLYSALYHIIVEKHLVPEYSGTKKTYSLIVQELREKLFNIAINSDSEESELAKECLEAIDKMHDDYFSQVKFEVRHPDIKSGKPWPLIDIFQMD